MTALGSRTTALEALQGVSLAGKKAIVTGASSGIGVETARALAHAGADVILAVRSVEAGERTRAEIESGLPKEHGLVSVARLDLSDLRVVREFAEQYLRSGAALDLLINNAGVMAPPLGTTAQGFELQMGTNHLGHFLLTNMLVEPLSKSEAARVVTVSSDLHRRGKNESVLRTLDDDPKFEKRKYSGFDAYGDSKLANVLFTRALVKRMPESVLAFSLHPGVIPTNLSRHMGIAGSLFGVALKVFSKSISQGASTSVYGATSPDLEGRSGAYLFDCRVKEPSKDALDDDAADKVWALSERAVARAR
jgi:NAD(P)-dependent dehydrogenase (short-subunit alcohol dehydrogenase family)